MVLCLFVQHGKPSEFGSENRPNDLGTETYRMMGSGTYRTVPRQHLWRRFEVVI